MGQAARSDDVLQRLVDRRHPRAIVDASRELRLGDHGDLGVDLVRVNVHDAPGAQA